MTESEIVTDAKRVHSWKAPSPILVTESPIVTDAKLEHPEKADLPIFMFAGTAELLEACIFADRRPLHRAKAAYPISITEEGIEIVSNADC